MDKDHIIKVLTTSLENKRKAKPELDRLFKAYKEVQAERDKAIQRVSESFDRDLTDIEKTVETLAEEQNIPVSIGYLHSGKHRFLSTQLHSELCMFDYKMATVKKSFPDLAVSDEAIIDMFANEFGDVIQYWSPSNCY